MIPGDIDLTENLDFRKVVRRDIPQLPEVWNDKSKKIEYKRLDSTSTFTSSSLYHLSFYNYSNDIITTTSNDYFIDTIYDEINEIINVTDIDTGISTITYNYNNGDVLIRTTISTDLSTNTYISYANEYVDAITSSSNYFKLCTKENKDIFGNVKSYSIIDDIPKIPWDVMYYGYIRAIPWNTHKYYDTSRYYIREELPWGIECETTTPNLSSPERRAMNLISWLSEKTYSFVNNYLKSKEDADLSYLTNMNWLRIRDAIID